MAAWQYWGACSREKYCGELAIRSLRAALGGMLQRSWRWAAPMPKQKLDPYVLAITIFAIASVAVAGTAVALYAGGRAPLVPASSDVCLLVI